MCQAMCWVLGKYSSEKRDGVPAFRGLLSQSGGRHPSRSGPNKNKMATEVDVTKGFVL